MNADKKNRLLVHLLLFVVLFVVQLITTLVTGLLIYLAVYSGLVSEEWLGTDNVGRLILMMGLVLNVIGVLVVLICVFYPLRPFHRLIEQINRLAEGDFSARLHFGSPLSSYPVFQELSQSFNKLAVTLDNTQTLNEDFVNNFSHEFKTPIVSIAGFAKILRRGHLSEAQQAHYLAVIEKESLRLSQLANSVLELTHIENQTILTEIESVNVSEQLRASLLLLEDKWQQKQLDLHIDFAEHYLYGNARLLQQVWINLLDNAIKFSPLHGALLLHLDEHQGNLHVSITNFGEAIPPEKQASIFNKFYQADESHASEGSGIGLAIVKAVVELHQGHIDLRCDNGCTTFTVSLPLQLVH